MSSIGVNGESTSGVPFSCDDAPKPEQPYAKGKWQAERAISGLMSEGATDFVILRPPLVYGANCPGNFAKLMRFVARTPIIPLGAVKSRRSFIFIENLTDAILTAALHQSASRRTFLVADRESLSLSELVRILAALSRPKRNVVEVPIRLLRFLARLAGKQRMLDKLTSELLVDATEFSRVTGWEAPFSALHGLRITAQSFIKP
jgi:nucleoside-diphosphate-sugar epimerase